MKCKVIQDLLPLYIDGLTSEESNKEIEKHLKTCKECRECCQEMKGEIDEPVVISDEEIHDVELLKKIKKRRRRIGIAGGIIAAAALIMVLTLMQPKTYSKARYEDVTLTYGTRGDVAYLTMETKPGYDIVFTGANSYLKVLSVEKSFGMGKGSMGWEEEIGPEDDPCRWTIEFSDKIVVFENGELVEEKDK